MPIYEYECKKCGHKFEFFKMNREKEPDKCPVCKGSVRRLISGGIGFIFKGSGFYATDYRNKKSEKATEKSKKSSCSTCSGGTCSTCN